MEIREYTTKDLRYLFSINKICHDKPQPNLGILEQLHKGQTWVAVVNGEVVGFLLSVYREGPYVYNVAVLPEYRNKGIASALFAKFHDFYEGIGEPYLYVNATNPAQNLYCKLGIGRDQPGYEYGPVLGLCEPTGVPVYIRGRPGGGSRETTITRA